MRIGLRLITVSGSERHLLPGRRSQMTIFLLYPPLFDQVSDQEVTMTGIIGNNEHFNDSEETWNLNIECTTRLVSRSVNCNNTRLHAIPYVPYSKIT